MNSMWVNPFETSPLPDNSKTDPSPQPPLIDDAKLFRKFVLQHVSTALNDGFNDNIGRTNNVMPLFELPTHATFVKIYMALVDLFFKSAAPVARGSSKINTIFNQLKSHVDIDAQFSENRCKKVLPTALSVYQENLPVHYTKLQHQQRVS
jgi:protein SMG8